MTSIEALTPKELQALSGYEMASALNELIAEMSEIGREAISARIQLAKAKKAVLRAGSREAAIEAKADAIDAQAVLDTYRDRARTLRDLRSILQTLIRAIPA